MVERTSSRPIEPTPEGRPPGTPKKISKELTDSKAIVDHVVRNVFMTHNATDLHGHITPAPKIAGKVEKLLHPKH